MSAPSPVPSRTIPSHAHAVAEGETLDTAVVRPDSVTFCLSKWGLRGEDDERENAANRWQKFKVAAFLQKITWFAVKK